MEAVPSSSPSARQPAAPTLDLSAVKARQQATWADGDYAVIGSTLQLTGEALCEAVDLRAGERVLDVACGNGNAALAAARRWALVTGLDYVPALLARARARAAAEGLSLDLREGDAEDLPFPDGAFDVVLSTFGVMFTPDQARAARELLRVCRRGGRIGLTCWTPDGFIGEVFRVVGSFVPPPPGLQPPALWGTEARLRELLGAGAGEVRAERRAFAFRYRSPEHWVEVFRAWYGPVRRAFAALAPDRQAALAEALVAAIARRNQAHDGTMVVPGDYLEVVVVRA